MSRHLPLLQNMFPEQILLSVDQIAKCLKWSKGHVYNLSYTKKLPFPLIEGSGGVQVSIIAMADYLDTTLEPKVVEDKSIPVPDLIDARRRGRPRGSVTRRQMAFQLALSLAIVGQELESSFEELLQEVDAFTLQDGSETCSDKFDRSKNEIVHSIFKAKSALFASVLTLQLRSIDQHKKPTVGKI